MNLSRRQFLASTAAAAALVPVAATCRAADAHASLADNEIGITTGSFSRLLSVDPEPGKLRMLDLPKRMKNEMGMRVIDLMTRTLPSFEPSYLDALRNEADKHGCVLTNLKLNEPTRGRSRDLGSADETARREAIEGNKREIDAAARLGTRWVRPVAGRSRADLERIVASCRELADYAAPLGITIVIENNGWISRDAEAIPELVAAVGKGAAAQPDVGNWNDDGYRYAGLPKAFPLAVSCDFKAFEMGPNGEHAQYDLRRCFELGRDAGFKGPWCIEHANPELEQTFKEMAMIADQLRSWMKA